MRFLTVRPSGTSGHTLGRSPDTQDPGPSFSLAQPPKVQGGQGSGVGPALRHRGTAWDSVFLGQEGAQASLNTEAMRGRRAANPPNPVLGVGWGVSLWLTAFYWAFLLHAIVLKET